METGLKSLTGFKLYATSANIVVPCKRTQHVGPNNVTCCWPTMLRSFAQAFTRHKLTRVRPDFSGQIQKTSVLAQNWANQVSFSHAGQLVAFPGEVIVFCNQVYCFEHSR